MITIIKAWWSTTAGVLGFLALIFSGGVTFGRSNVEAKLEVHAGPVHEQLDKRMEDLIHSNERLVVVNDRLTEQLKEQNRIVRSFLPLIGKEDP